MDEGKLAFSHLNIPDDYSDDFENISEEIETYSDDFNEYDTDETLSGSFINPMPIVDDKC
eukprot:CAMPEP_0168315800 /NCGR_PEP_ID=MMETSP0210-20121227/12738_1 /TAXON_ID=40633 /ORGANISM="Condylostoma magnum, Strain COL2" /LENGTH=59 /DNA_ID=CAMNT_0008291589 /DNA_START=336 /DNA_END=515 /DNA_ORIENTATION=-